MVSNGGARMRRLLISLGLAASLLGCATGEVSQEDRDACIAAGHVPGSQAFEICLQDRLAERFARSEGESIDDLRVRMGPRLGTGPR